MPRLLLIDAATSSCRVGVVDGVGVLSQMTVEEHFKHAERLTLLIEQCMAESDTLFTQLDGVAITGGPGSYTGLRIGASVAKGIAFAHQTPLLALNTLEVMAKGYQLSTAVSELAAIVPMLDARRMEVFTAAFSSEGKTLMSPQPLILAADSYAGLEIEGFHFFGDGAAKFEALFEGVAVFDSNMYLGIEPMRELALLQFQLRKFEDIAYYRPDYHKDFYSTAANK